MNRSQCYALYIQPALKKPYLCLHEALGGRVDINHNFLSLHSAKTHISFYAKAFSLHLGVAKVFLLRLVFSSCISIIILVFELSTEHPIKRISQHPRTASPARLYKPFQRVLIQMAGKHHSNTTTSLI